jgi:hypothetical protein
MIGVSDAKGGLDLVGGEMLPFLETREDTGEFEVGCSTLEDTKVDVPVIGQCGGEGHCVGGGPR